MRSEWVYRVILFFTVLLHFCLAYWIDRSSSLWVASSFGLLWIAFLIQRVNWKISTKQVIAFGMLLRLIYLIAMPELSDDVFRYIWDGLQYVNGVSPYEWTPTEWMGKTDGIAFQQLYPLLNSPDYYSIYPPVLQFFYGFSAWLSGGDVQMAIVTLRLFVLLAELGSMLLIWKLLVAWKMSSRNLMLYALNPLVIVEFSGSLHNEVFMVFFLLLSLYLLIQNWRRLSALAFAASVGVKLLPLMFLPFLIRRIGLWRSILYGALVGAALLLMYVPFWSENLIAHNLDSLSLYFANFEFNASIYYVIREIGFQIKGYNIIGTTAIWLPRIVLLSILLLAFFNRDRKLSSLPRMMLFAWVIYYVLATTVHPWYIAVLAMFLPFVKYRFALLWLILIPLSYHAYGNMDCEENLWIVAIEYVPVYILLLLEMTGKDLSDSLPILKKFRSNNSPKSSG